MIAARPATPRATLARRAQATPLDELVWSHRPERHRPPRGNGDWQSTTPESVALSKALKKAGFRFVGPTTVYAAMQACGIVNDHLADCFVREDVERAIRAATTPARRAPAG